MRAWSVVVCSLAAVLAFCAGVLGGVELASREHILPGVSVLGTSVGGLTVDEASTRLSPRSQAILDAPLQVQAGTRSWTTSPRALGLKLEPTELASSAFRIGHSGPLPSMVREQVAALRSDVVVPVSSSGEAAALDELISRIAADVDTPARAAELSLAADGAITFVPSQNGEALDRPASRTLVAQALADGSTNVLLVTRTLAPPVQTAQVAAAHDQLSKMLADAAPVQLKAGQERWTIDRSQLLDLIVLTQPDARGSAASVSVKDEPLQELLQNIGAKIDKPAQDARFSYDNGQLTPLRPSHDGQALNQSAALDLVKTRLMAGERSLDLPVDVVRPAVAVEDAAKLGIRELVGESTTSFAGSIPEKAQNIKLAAERLNGVVVPPGATFSFNKEVGPTTLEAGFQWGFGLTTGGQGAVHTVPSVAGGICQVATTLFQPVFWSGYQLEERYWHLYWIPAYTSRGVVGLDATVDADSGLDLKWINPTSQPVLIQASTDAEHVTFRLFGQKPPWNVQVDDPVVSNRVVADPTPEVQEEPSLPWGRTLLVESARDGFQVVLVRHVTPTGSGAPRELPLKSVYAPAHTVTLVGTRDAPDPASVAAAVDRVRASQQVSAAAPAPSSQAATTHATPNGPRTMAQIRDELRRAGWGGGSDQDALATYERVAGAASH